MIQLNHGKIVLSAIWFRWKAFSRKKKALIILLMILTATLFIYLGIRIANFHQVSGYAEWRSSNSQSYLYVEAPTNFELGYLTGQKLADKILQLKLFLMIAAPKYQTDYQSLLNQANSYLPFIPAQHQEEFQGLAAGSSNELGLIITFQDILLQNCWLDITYGQLLPKSYNPVGCTALGLVQANGSVIMAQNFDFIQSFAPTLSFVYHKLGSNPGIFSLRFGAGLDLPIGCNTNNVTVLTTVVRSTQIAPISMPVCSRARLSFEQATDMSSFYQTFFGSTPINTNQNVSVSFNLIIGDSTHLMGVESLPLMQQINDSKVIVKTNTYSVPDWQQYLEDKNYSKDRQSLAEQLLTSLSIKSQASQDDLFTILKVNPGICQIANQSSDVGTLAFISRKYFGLGSPSNSLLGVIPF
jgi:hypothetical protein